MEKSIDFVDKQLYIHSLYRQYGTNQLIIQEMALAQREIIREVQKEPLILMEYADITIAIDVNHDYKRYLVRKTKTGEKKSTALCFYDNPEFAKKEYLVAYFENFKNSLEAMHYQITSLVYLQSYVLVNAGIQCLCAEVKKI